MENTQKLVFTDTSKIKKVVFKYPELMISNAEDIIKEEYNKLLELKEELYSARNKVIELEKQLLTTENKFREKTHNCTIEFETYEKEYKTESSTLFIGGQGNDILGTFGN